MSKSPRKMIHYREIVLSILLLPSMLYGQIEETGSGNVEDAEILIEKDRKIELGKERKIYSFMRWRPETDSLVLPADVVDEFHFPLVIEPTKLKRPEYKKEEKQADYHQFVKFGFGNYGSPLAILNLRTPGDPNLSAGLDLSHLSFASGPVDTDNSAMSDTEVTAYGYWLTDKLSLKPSVNYRHQRNYFYGYESGVETDREDILRANNYVDLGVQLLDNEKGDEWNYATDISWQNFSDNYNNTENTLRLDASLNYQKKFFLDSELRSSKLESVSGGRLYYRLNPYYRFELGELIARVGFSFSSQNDNLPSLNRHKVFPYLEADYMITDQVMLYLEVDGGFDFNSAFTFAENQPFLNPVFGVANSERIFDITAGSTWSPSRQWVIESKLNFYSVRYLPVFVNNIDDQSMLDVVYDSGSVGVFNVGVSGNYYLSDKHTLRGVIDLYSYSTDSLDAVYHMPTLELSFGGDHYFTDKFSAYWNFNWLNGLKARNPIDGSELDLDAIYRLDLGAHYQIKDQIGAFVSIENAFSQEYVRYLFYPQRGLMFKMGLTARF